MRLTMMPPGWNGQKPCPRDLAKEGEASLIDTLLGVCSAPMEPRIELVDTQHS